jgi:hypothetical protein
LITSGFIWLFFFCIFGNRCNFAFFSLCTRTL